MRVLLILLVGGVLLSCDNRRVFERNEEFDSRVWKALDTVKFYFDVPDATRRYDIFLNVRNSIDYPFARLFVNYSLADSTGAVLANDLLMKDLFDQKTGKPFGESGIGDIYDHQFLVLPGYQFNQQGEYSVMLQQFNRVDTLGGVLAVGVRVALAEP